MSDLAKAFDHRPMDDRAADSLSDEELFLEIARLITKREDQQRSADNMKDESERCEARRREFMAKAEQSYNRQLELQTVLAKRKMIS